MDRNEAYEMAVQMFQLEAERWAKNALGLAVVLAAIFAAYGQVKDNLSIAWPCFLASAVSLAGVLIALSIRGTTDAWQETVKTIESSPEGNAFRPYHMFDDYLHKDCPWKCFPPYKDLCEVLPVIVRALGLGPRDLVSGEIRRLVLGNLRGAGYYHIGTRLGTARGDCSAFFSRKSTGFGAFSSVSRGFMPFYLQQPPSCSSLLASISLCQRAAPIPWVF